jgi:hypothetical protein
MVTERALTILRIRRSTKDVFLPGLTTLSGIPWEFNEQADSPCASPRSRGGREPHAAIRPAVIRIRAQGALERSLSTTASSVRSQVSSVFHVNRCSGAWKSPVATNGSLRSATQWKLLAVEELEAVDHLGRPLRVLCEPGSWARACAA